MGIARFTFLLFAVVTVLLAVRMVTTQRLVHSLLLHILSLTSLGIAYLIAGAYLIGAVQIMVYAGSVTVMFVFALMLTPLGQNAGETLDHRSRLRAALAAVAAFVLVAAVILALPAASHELVALDVESIGMELFTAYAYPFELLALVLTAALVGVAVIVGRSAQHEAASPPAGDGDQR